MFPRLFGIVKGVVSEGRPSCLAHARWWRQDSAVLRAGQLRTFRQQSCRMVLPTDAWWSGCHACSV